MTKKLKVLAVLALALAIGGGQVAAQSWLLDSKHDLSRIRYHVVSGGTEQIVYNGAALLLGLIRSTGAEAAVLFIRDTTVANGYAANTRQVLPRIHFFVGTGVTDNAISSPIPVRLGISADLDVVNFGEQATIVYLPLY